MMQRLQRSLAKSTITKSLTPAACWLQVEMSSFGEKSVETEWEEVLAPERMAALSHHDAKLLLLALRRQEFARKAQDREEDHEYGGGGSLWDTVQIVPGSRADQLPQSLSTLTALAAGNVMLKI